MIRAIMHGCNGKMGKIIAGLIEEEEGMPMMRGKILFPSIEALRTVPQRQM